MIHFNLSNSKGKNSDPLPNLIDLPELPTVNINPVSILKKLKEGSTIWAWYKIMDFKVKKGKRQLNLTALENISYRFDGLTALKKSGDYLIYYRVEIGSSFGIYVKPSMIYALKNSCLAEIFSVELANAYKLFLDENSDFFASCGSFTHSFSKEEIDSYMDWHRYLTIEKEKLVSWQTQSKRFINPDALT